MPEPDEDPNGIAHRVAAAMAREAVENLGLAELISHPGERGRARETTLKEFLRQLVPQGFGVGDGFVIDVHGNSSRQQDVVIYRRDYHPIFLVGGVTYYPVEAVAACIEVKSRLDSEQFVASLANTQSVKALDRSAGGSNYIVHGGAGGNRGPDVNPDGHEHQIFAAVVAAKAISVETIVQTMQNHLHGTQRREWPNVICVAKAWSLSYEPSESGRPRSDSMNAVGIRYSPVGHRTNVEPLLDLAEQLWSFLRIAPIIDVQPQRYIRASWWAQAVHPLFPEGYSDDLDAPTSS